MKSRFARGSLNSCSSELVCIEKKGTSEILKHSEAFTRTSSELVTAVPIRGGAGVSRRVERNYRGKSCTKVLRSSVRKCKQDAYQRISVVSRTLTSLFY